LNGIKARVTQEMPGLGLDVGDEVVIASTSKRIGRCVIVWAEDGHTKRASVDMSRVKVEGAGVE
jgi:hypothetical protein